MSGSHHVPTTADQVDQSNYFSVMLQILRKEQNIFRRFLAPAIAGPGNIVGQQMFIEVTITGLSIWIMGLFVGSWTQSSGLFRYGKNVRMGT